MTISTNSSHLWPWFSTHLPHWISFSLINTSQTKQAITWPRALCTGLCFQHCAWLASYASGIHYRYFLLRKTVMVSRDTPPAPDSIQHSVHTTNQYHSAYILNSPRKSNPYEGLHLQHFLGTLNGTESQNISKPSVKCATRSDPNNSNPTSHQVN